MTSPLVTIKHEKLVSRCSVKSRGCASNFFLYRQPIESGCVLRGAGGFGSILLSSRQRLLTSRKRTSESFTCDFRLCISILSAIMKFMYDGTFEGHYFTCFSMNVHVQVWIFNRGEPKDSVLILASNVTADESGLKHALGYSGVVFKANDIENVQATSHYYNQSKLS